MDLHQKISIGIFGALLLGTLAMYSTGSLSSSVINTDTVEGAIDCTDAYMKSYATQYTTDQETLKELQQFVGRNCRGDVVESKKSYCDARKKQIVTYSTQMKKYETCLESLNTTAQS